jgi:hypothetical protein
MNKLSILIMPSPNPPTAAFAVTTFNTTAVGSDSGIFRTPEARPMYPLNGEGVAVNNAAVFCEYILGRIVNVFAIDIVTLGHL